MTEDQYRICKRIISGVTNKLGSRIDIALRPEELAGDAWESAVRETRRYDPSQGNYDSWIVNRIYTDIIDRIRAITKYRAKTMRWAPSRSLRSWDYGGNDNDMTQGFGQDDAVEKTFDIDAYIDLDLFLRGYEERTAAIIRMRIAGMTMTDIGDALEISCARVSQILKATKVEYEEWRKSGT